MLLRILGDSLLRQKRRKLVVLAAVTLGTAAAAALADIAMDIGDKMSQELKRFGANLVLLPAQGSREVKVAGEEMGAWLMPSYLSAADIPHVKDNFWKNNILAFAPILEARVHSDQRTVALWGTWFDRAFEIPSGERFVTGIRSLNPAWSVKGRWIEDLDPGDISADPAPALVGVRLAAELGVDVGSRLSVRGEDGELPLQVVGLVRGGGDEEDAILVTLETAWKATGASGKITRVAVSALTTPENAFYARLGSDPRKIPPSEFERWSCTPFVSSIAYELERSVPGSRARIVRRVAESEGRILHRVSSLLLLLALMAGFGATLAVTSALTAAVLERRAEFGLLKALGAGNASVIGLLAAEAGILGIAGGLFGALAGAYLARWISMALFGSPVAIPPLAVPLAVAAALVMVFLGCVIPARRLLRLHPFEMLRGL